MSLYGAIADGIPVPAIVFITAAVLTVVLAHTAFAGNRIAPPEVMAYARVSPPGSCATTVPVDDNRVERLVLNNADGPWTASPHVAARPDASHYVEGSASARFLIEEGFETGVVAYDDIRCPAKGEYISFWIRSSAQLEDGVLQLRLGDDGFDSGVGLAIPGAVLDACWHRAAIDLTGFDIEYSTARSIALYAAKDPGEVTVWLDIMEVPAGNALPPSADRLRELV
jgi:hypothetical protein